MVSEITLQDFRNFSEKQVKFSPKTTLIVGPNGSGKTNILEAVNLLATGKSFRARVESEMVRHEGDVARVWGEILSPTTASELQNDNQEAADLEVVFTRGQVERGGLIKKAAKKRVLVNGVGKRLQDFIGHFNTVVFRPAELELVTESPSVRRNFLDTVLSQVDYEYRRALLSYEKGMRRRNKILLAIRDEGKSRSELYFWDKLLIKNGEYIASKRSDFIDFVNRFEFVGSSEYSILYDRSVISEERLKQYERQEVFAGKTLVGPHRDDIKFKITNAKLKIERELDAFGSRGEQRMGVLWVKVAEIDFIERRLGRRPTLLLDDIFSELDHGHRVLVGDLAHKQQTILTTSDSHFAQELGAADIIELEG